MKSYLSIDTKRLIQYFTTLNVAFHDIHSIFGFFILLVITSQLVSGTMLSFSLIPEPMIIPIVRDEEDLEDLYADDFFWLHERGVDLLFIFSWFHLFRKLYLNLVEYEHENTWKSGVFSFLILHVVTFMGLVLCCTHLSEITLIIAVNMINTFVLNIGKFYWWLFTDKQLNSDTVVRLAYLHYVSAFFLLYLGVIHAFDMHYDWKNESAYDGLDFELSWWDEALLSELTWSIVLILLFTVLCWNWYPEPEALSYELFMWGDIGLINDVRFYGVAPHWYFRPYMAWLIAVPYHNTGIFGLIYFFWVLFNQPAIHGVTDYLFYLKKVLIFLKFKLKQNLFFKNSNILNEINLYHQLTFFFFFMCCLYTTSFLPYGRFYNRIGGNTGMLIAYLYVFMYLTFNVFRRPILLDLILFNFFHKVRYLNGVNTLNLVSTIK